MNSRGPRSVVRRPLIRGRRLVRAAGDSKGRVAARGSPAGHRQLGADDGFDARTRRGEVKSWRAVDAVAIEQRQRRIAERDRPIDSTSGSDAPSRNENAEEA